MPKKIYLAFISSEYERLKEQRNEIIDALLDFDIMPVGMEHFTTSYNGNFTDIERFIDQSDFFVLLMSDSYGSTDSNGISWTEREFDYAVAQGKKILALVLPELAEKVGKDYQGTPADEHQINFYNKVYSSGFARNMNGNVTVDKTLRQFFGKSDSYIDCLGWQRPSRTMTETELREWQENNKSFDIGGTWYHMHLNGKDKKYIRIGTVTIKQNFTPDEYRSLTLRGENYSIRYYDTESGKFNYDRDQYSEFYGDYTLDDGGKIIGIFNTKRYYRSTFNNTPVTEGIRRGIHEFKINLTDTSRIFGDFHDEAPSPKLGQIYLFRNEEDRDFSLFNEREGIISKLCKKNKHNLPKDFKITRNKV